MPLCVLIQLEDDIIIEDFCGIVEKVLIESDDLSIVKFTFSFSAYWIASNLDVNLFAVGFALDSGDRYDLESDACKLVLFVDLNCFFSVDH